VFVDCLLGVERMAIIVFHGTVLLLPWFGFSMAASIIILGGSYKGLWPVKNNN